MGFRILTSEDKDAFSFDEVSTGEDTKLFAVTNFERTKSFCCIIEGIDTNKKLAEFFRAVATAIDRMEKTSNMEIE